MVRSRNLNRDQIALGETKGMRRIRARLIGPVNGAGHSRIDSIFSYCEDPGVSNTGSGCYICEEVPHGPVCGKDVLNITLGRARIAREHPDEVAVVDVTSTRYTARSADHRSSGVGTGRA